jgi:AraC-like DNA-binding protein
LSTKDVTVEGSAVQDAAGEGLDMRIASELIERARAEGVSLVGRGGLLQQVTRAVLQAALEAEMADHLPAPDRLAGAHQDLRNATPATTTVAAVATRWAFPDPGRFTAAYRAAYGVTPPTPCATPDDARLCAGTGTDRAEHG